MIVTWALLSLIISSYVKSTISTQSIGGMESVAWPNQNNILEQSKEKDESTVHKKINNILKQYHLLEIPNKVNPVNVEFEIKCSNGDHSCVNNMVLEKCALGEWKFSENCSESGRVCFVDQCVDETINSTPTEKPATSEKPETSVIPLTSEKPSSIHTSSSTYSPTQISTTTTTSASTATTPPRKCTLGDMGCNGSWIEICGSPGWISIADCELKGMTCSGGICVPKPVQSTTLSSQCTIGDTGCSGSWIAICSSVGWTNVADCSLKGMTCSAGDCVVQ